MPRTYYDISLALLDALIYPADVDADDGAGGTLLQQQRRRLIRRLMYRARRDRHAQAIMPRLNVDRTRVLMETEDAPPLAITVAGPMTQTECLAYLASDLAWSNG